MVTFSSSNECYTLFVTTGVIWTPNISQWIVEMFATVLHYLSCPEVFPQNARLRWGSAVSANQGGEGVGLGDQTRKNVQNYSKIEKFVICTPKPGIYPGFQYRGCWLNPSGVTKSRSQPITSRGSWEHFELYTTWEYNMRIYQWMTWQSKSPLRDVLLSCERVFVKTRRGIYP